MHHHRQDNKSLANPSQHPRPPASASNPVTQLNPSRGEPPLRLISGPSGASVSSCQSHEIYWLVSKPELQSFTEEGKGHRRGHSRPHRHVSNATLARLQARPFRREMPACSHRMLSPSSPNPRTSLSGDEENVGSHQRRKSQPWQSKSEACGWSSPFACAGAHGLPATGHRRRNGPSLASQAVVTECGLPCGRKGEGGGCSARFVVGAYLCSQLGEKQRP